MKRRISETSERNYLHRSGKKKIKQAGESLISMKWLFGFICPRRGGVFISNPPPMKLVDKMPHVLLVYSYPGPLIRLNHTNSC
jgi:hypothetical protein